MQIKDFKVGTMLRCLAPQLVENIINEYVYLNIGDIFKIIGVERKPYSAGRYKLELYTNTFNRYAYHSNISFSEVAPVTNSELAKIRIRNA